MKGSVYEKQLNISHIHEVQVEKESTIMHRLIIQLSGTAITIGRGGKCNYPLTTGKTLEMMHVDMSTLYVQGDGNDEVIYILGTEE